MRQRPHNRFRILNTNLPPGLPCLLLDRTDSIYNTFYFKCIYIYRKRPYISGTFFYRIEAKNQGCGLSTDTAVIGVRTNIINIHKTSQDVKN